MKISLYTILGGDLAHVVSMLFLSTEFKHIRRLTFYLYHIYAYNSMETCIEGHQSNYNVLQYVLVKIPPVIHSSLSIAR